MAILLVASAIRAQQTVYVRAGATGANDGTSWTDAYDDLQPALAQAPSHSELWLAAGTYLPSSQGDRNATFALRSDVAILGGFAGHETSRDARDPAAHETILSGDLDRNDPQLSGTGWYSQSGNWAGNSFHVVTADAIDATAVLDGVTVMNGSSVMGLPAWGYGGAGLIATQSSPTIVDCRFVHHYASGGGAVLVDGGEASFTDCQFEENLSFANHGGALYLRNAGRARIAHCDFVGNDALQNGGPNSAGGAIYIDFGCTDVVVADCTFTRNRSIARFAPSGIYAMIGGGLFNGATNTIVERCRFTANITNEGGGICSFRPIAIVDCVFDANRVTSFDTGGGSTGGWGGGIAIVEYGSVTTRSTVRGSTFYRNTATDSGGGIFVAGASNTAVSNCILRENTDSNGMVNRSQSSGAKAKYSDVSGLLRSPPGEDPIDPRDYPGSFDADPLFVDADGPDGITGTADDDFRLLAASPCIDRGDPATNVDGLDLGAVPRRLDGDLDFVLRVDCGAHEFAHVELAVRVTPVGGGDATVDFALSGTSGHVAVLAIGVRGAETQLGTLGGLFLDLGAPLLAADVGTVPATVSVTTAMLGFDFTAQAISLAPDGAGNLGNVVMFRL